MNKVILCFCTWDWYGWNQMLFASNYEKGFVDIYISIIIFINVHMPAWLPRRKARPPSQRDRASVLFNLLIIYIICRGSILVRFSQLDINISCLEFNCTCLTDTWMGYNLQGFCTSICILVQLFRCGYVCVIKLACSDLSDQDLTHSWLEYQFIYAFGVDFIRFDELNRDDIYRST